MEHKDEQERKIPFSFTLGDALTVSYFTLLLYVISFFTDTAYKSYFHIPVYYSEFTLDYYLGSAIMIPIMLIVIIATIWSSSIQDGVLRSVRRAKFYNERNYQSAKTLMSVIYRYFILYSIAGMFRLVGENQYVVYVFLFFLFEFILIPFLTSIFYYFHKGVIRLQSMIKKKSFFLSNPPPRIPWKYRWKRYKKLYLRIVKEQRNVFEFYRYFPSTVQMLLMMVLLSLIIIFFAYKTGFYTAQNQTYFYTVKMEKNEKWVVLGTYDDSLIVAPLRKKQIEDKFRLLDRKSKEALSADYEKVGPLKVAGKKAGDGPVYHYLK
jgi:hypothetical protein